MFYELGFLLPFNCAQSKAVAENPQSPADIEGLETHTGPSWWEFIYANPPAWDEEPELQSD